MVDRLSGSRSRRQTMSTGPMLELEVTNGLDAGQHFTLEGEEVTIGRAASRGSGLASILIHDPTVSLSQATFRKTGGGYEIVHDPQATNWTRVNGEVVDRVPIHPGDQIQMGHVTMSVIRGSDFPGLTGTQRILEDSTQEIQPADTVTIRAITSDDTTQIQAVTQPVGFLVLIRGLEPANARRFPIRILSSWKVCIIP